MSDNVLKIVGIKKSFAGVKALKSVNLDIKKGEIHCLAGENGCGKSTMIKIVSGVYTMDEGHIEINGKTYTKITPMEAIQNGIQVIYQDFSIFANLTVMENLAFNSLLSRKRKLVNWNEFRKIATEAVSKINFQVDLDAKVGDLSVADKQLIAISRALVNNANLIIMDEPTTALTKREVAALFTIILDLQKQGIAILFVSHKLDEVFEISQRFTILRNGENVASGNTSDLDHKKFTYYMTGREFSEQQFVSTYANPTPVLEVNQLNLTNGFYDINFNVQRGEVLGITGLLGSGRTELALSLFGVRKPDSGSIKINGKTREIRSIRDAVACKVGYVPEDRLTEGLFLSRSIGNNIILSKIDQLTKGPGMLDTAAIDSEVNLWVSKLKIATPNPDNAASTLSGGNQQRIVLAKWLALNPDVLILNGPTVGVDIGSKHDIHEILHELANQGMAIIIISDDIPEIMANCSRILIMRGGRITGEYDPKEIDEPSLSRIMTAGKASAESNERNAAQGRQ